MKLRYILTGLFLIKFSATFPQKNNYKADSLFIEKLNSAAYDIRLNDPHQTVRLGLRALAIAKEKGYKNEIGAASRIVGIGYYNIYKTDSAVLYYNNALLMYKETGNIEGQARVYNNIGNLYRDVDYEAGLSFFRKSLQMAIKANLDDLIAATYLNIGIIFHRKEQYKEALANYEKSLAMFKRLNNETGQIMSLQNMGVVRFALGEIPTAERLLLQAHKRAKENKLNKVAASVNLTLTSIYISDNDFKKAESAIDEGVSYARESKSKELERDYIWKSYELERKRKNYKEALSYFTQVYTIDSANFDNVKLEQIKLLTEQFKLLQKEKQNQIIIERQKKNKVLLFASVAISVLAFFVIFLLVKNVRKKAKTNRLLKILNEEVSLQKENLDKVNHSLEQIIDERTKDLQIKNRKLSEYSSHLSHQIRGPIATMKGLMILEQEKLIEETEFVEEMGKCVNEIDDRIININNVLHNLSESGLIPKVVDKENQRPL